MTDISVLAESAIVRYREKMMRICLECPHYPDNCPPRRCPVHLGLTLPPCSSRSTLLDMIKKYR